MVGCMHGTNRAPIWIKVYKAFIVKSWVGNRNTDVICLKTYRRGRTDHNVKGRKLYSTACQLIIPNELVDQYSQHEKCRQISKHGWPSPTCKQWIWFANHDHWLWLWRWWRIIAVLRLRVIRVLVIVVVIIVGRWCTRCC